MLAALPGPALMVRALLVPLRSPAGAGASLSGAGGRPPGRGAHACMRAAPQARS